MNNDIEFDYDPSILNPATQMNSNDYNSYFRPVMDKFGMKDPCELDRLLGLEMWENFQRRSSLADKPMDDRMRNLFRGLMGPHSSTILKLWEIRKR
jgi:hypothetical protein